MHHMQGHMCFPDIYTSLSANGVIVLPAHIFRCNKVLPTFVFFNDLGTFIGLHPIKVTHIVENIIPTDGNWNNCLEALNVLPV